MIIGFDAKRLYNNFTGLGNYSRTLLHNLLLYSPDNEYYLYTPSIKDDPQMTEFRTSNNCKTFVPDTLFKSYWRTFSLLKQLERDKIQLYHGLSHELPAGIRKSKIRSIVTMHDLIYKIYPATYNFTDRKLYDAKYRYSCNNSDIIVAISESTKKDVINLYGIESEKIEVIYQSCNPVYFTEVSDEIVSFVTDKYCLPENYLLYVGSITERKNLAAIVQAYDFLPDDLKLPIVIVGNGGSYRNKVEAMIEKRNMGKSVIWINNLSNHEELRILYSQASVFIYPSVYEGFGIPVIEAILSHTPVITSNVSSLPEAGGPGSFYINPTDAEQLAGGIKKILSDTTYRKKMVESSYSYALEKFGAETNTKKLVNLYKKLV